MPFLSLEMAVLARISILNSLHSQRCHCQVIFIIALLSILPILSTVILSFFLALLVVLARKR